MKKLQIGVIGSCSDLDYSEDAIIFARELGALIAEKGYALVYGAEKDINSLPTIAALAAAKIGGLTVGITYERGMDLFKDEAAQVVIATGLVRGGGREMVLMLSCDIVVAIAGGSGTLNEICVAYQANIPTIVVAKFGGWSGKLANQFLDDRNRYQFQVADTPERVLQLISNSRLVVGQGETNKQIFTNDV